MYHRLIISLQDEPDLTDEDILTITQAAAMLEMTTQGITSALTRGALSVIIETMPTGSTHRRVLRSEVEAMAVEKKTEEQKRQGKAELG